MSFKKAISRTFFSQIVSYGMLFIVGIITARILGPDQRGLYSIFFTTAGLILNLTGFGFAQSNVYYLNKDKNFNYILGNSLLMIVIQSLIIILLIIISEFIFNYSALKEFDFYTFILLAICGIFLVVDFVASGIVLGKHLYGLYNNNLIFQNGGILIASIILFAVNINGFHAILLRVIAIGIVLLFYIYNLSKKIKMVFPKISFSLLYLQILFGIKNYFQNLIGLLNYKIYFFFLATFIDYSSVAFFSIALLFVEILRFLPNAIGTILFPKLTTIDNKQEKVILTAQLCRYTILVSIFIVISVLIFIKLIVIYVFSIEYINVIPLVYIILPGGVFSILYQLLTRYFTSQHQQYFSIIAGVIALIFAALFSYLLIPFWGITGAAISFLICNITLGSLMVVFFCINGKINYKEVLLFNTSDYLLIKEMFIEKILNRKTNKN